MMLSPNERAFLFYAGIGPPTTICCRWSIPRYMRSDLVLYGLLVRYILPRLK